MHTKYQKNSKKQHILPNTNTIRLNKALAEAGLCSRRKADEYIQKGSISINGIITTSLGVTISPQHDVVALDGKPIPLKNTQSYCYILMHKPIMVVSTLYDPQKRPTIKDLLPQNLQTSHIYPIGRLDFFSEGLLLLTNDGALTYKLTHPKHHIPKVYTVLIRGELSPSIVKSFQKGFTLPDGVCLEPVIIKILDTKTKQGEYWVEFTIYQGHNRQIRKMCQAVGLTILKLIRTQHGPISLGNLPKNHIRPLTPREIESLRKAGYTSKH